jgi:signal transduction histidine kinase
VFVQSGKQIFNVRGESFVDQRGYGGSLLWLRDVTASRKAEMDREALEQKLHDERRIESLTVLASGLAHDFNNLLTAILGNADYLTSTLPVGSEQRISADAIATGAQHAADLVAQMVAFSGQGRTVVGPVALEEAVGDVIRALSRTRGERALVTHESEPDLPRLSGDVVQIRQAVLALLTNAVDAAADTHGSVEVVTGREALDAAALAAMTFSAADPGDFLFIEVRDEGTGMGKGTRVRVWFPL